MGLKESGLRGSLRSVSTGVPAIPDSAVLHLDATKLGLSDGESVSTWPDESGEGNDLSGSGPTYQESVQNGNPVVRFDGTDDILNNSSPLISQPYTTIVAIQAVTASDRHTIISTVDDGDQRAGFRYFFDTNDFQIFAGSSASGGSPTTDFIIATAIFDGAASEVRINGSTAFTGNPGSHPFGGFQLGEFYTGGDNLDGDIGEVGFYDANLASTGELADEEQRFADKWGISI